MSRAKRARAARGGGRRDGGPAKAVLALALLVAGCGGTAPEGQGALESSPGPALPWPATPLSEAPAPADNPTTEPKADLGRLLFYDPILGSDQATACATCHSEIWGMSDGLDRSIGVDGKGATGPGRVGPNVTRRNSQTLWNSAWRERLFWDGRALSLEDQVAFPLANAAEFGRDAQDVAADLAAIPDYAKRFAAAFPDEPKPATAENMARAIAAFERTLVSDWSPYDRYAAGDEGALKPQWIDGMVLFADAGCAGCHAPPRFETERYEDRGVFPIDGIDDTGRFEQTGDAADRNAFRVPTLRNLRETGPYFHTGQVATLEQAVALEAERANRALSEDEVAAIAAFLQKGLMDRSHEPERPDSVPSGLQVPVDGFRIPRGS